MAQSGDKFYTQPYRYGPKNTKLRQLNRDRDMSGVRGYPSNDDYMKLVGESKLEQSKDEMSAKGAEAEAKYERKRVGKRRSTSKASGRKAVLADKRTPRKRG